MREKRKLKIGLLTHNRNWRRYETKRLISAIEESGNELVKVDPFKDVLPINEDPGLDVLISRAQITNAKILQSYLRFLEYFEKKCPVINGSYSLVTCQDKYRTYFTLKEHHIPTPDTFLTYNKEKAIEIISYLGLPVVFKWIWKGSGKGIIKFDDRESVIEHIIELSKDRKPIFMQKYLDKIENRDIRVNVVGDKVSASIYRVAKEGEWITNISKGGTAVKAELSDIMKELAIKSARAVKADAAGVDLVKTKEGVYVLEVNITPKYAPPGTEFVTGANISKDIVDYACMKVQGK